MEDLSQSFKILEVDFNADLKTIQKSYHELCKVWHPDRFSDNDIRLKQKAETKIKELNDAYANISSWFDKNRSYISYAQYINQKKSQNAKDKSYNNTNYSNSMSGGKTSKTSYNSKTNYKPVVIIFLVVGIIGSFVWFDNQQKKQVQMQKVQKEVQAFGNKFDEHEKRRNGIKIIVSGTNGTKINVSYSTPERSGDFDTVVPYETIIEGDPGVVMVQKKQQTGAVKLKIVDGVGGILYEGETGTSHGMLSHRFSIPI